MSKLTFATVLAALSLASLVGCAGNETRSTEAQGDFARPQGLQAALENPIADCQALAIDCNNQAADLAASFACNDVFAACLRDAALRAQKVAELVDACRKDAQVCVQQGNDFVACSDGYFACSSAVLDGGGGGADAGAVPVDPPPALDGGTADPSGLPGLPDLPGLGDGGLLEDLPEPVRCTVELRLCIALDITAAAQCADTARTCLQLP